ncbi:MAG: CotH kinase family protein, partial [Fibrobacter sp.]|nr:CotH kinase family protein [Fibrobacter sp.]
PENDTVKATYVSIWTDSMENTGGHSTIVPYEYEDFLYTDSNNNRIVSATMNMCDNRPGLGWGSAQVAVRFKRTIGTGNDYSMYNTFRFNMTLEKDKLLVVRFVQKSIEEWKGATYPIKGTGIKNDTYQIRLVQGTDGLDLTKLTGIRIEAKEYNFGTVSFTLSNMVFSHSGNNLHTNFKLSKKSAGVYMSKNDSIVESFAKLYDVPHNYTQGLLDNSWKILANPTPEAPNDTKCYNAIADIPQSVTMGGFYDKAVSVKLTCAGNQEIRYTLDGSEPDQSSQLYTKELTIDSSAVLRYASFGDGFARSEIRTETFFINENVSLAVVSLSTNPALFFDSVTGIYMNGPNADEEYPYFGANFWQGKEVPVHVEFFETDKHKKFDIDAGASIAGNWSKGEKKKSIALDFREIYGESELKYPVFSSAPQSKKFKKLMLRNNGGNVMGAFIEDPFMQSLIANRDVDCQKYRPVVVFVNGKYFGLFQLMEPANHDYVYTNYGLSKEEIDFYDIEGKMKSGTPDNWAALFKLFKKAGVKATLELTDSIFALINDQMDIYNFSNYMAFEIFIGNTDWPSNNCRYWRKRAEGGRWRWLVFDTDYGFGCCGFTEDAKLVSYNTLEFALESTKPNDEYPNGSTYTFPLRALLQNQSFKEDFINRFATLLATNFSPENITAQIDKFAKEIEPEIKKDRKLWYPEKSYAQWKQCVERLKTYGNERGEYIYTFLQERFGCGDMHSVNISSGNGTVLVNDMSIDGTLNGTYFESVPLRLTAVPPGGMKFVKWSDGDKENPRKLTVTGDLGISPVFE